MRYVLLFFGIWAAALAIMMFFGWLGQLDVRKRRGLTEYERKKKKGDPVSYQDVHEHTKASAMDSYRGSVFHFLGLFVIIILGLILQGGVEAAIWLTLAVTLFVAIGWWQTRHDS